ncbi:MULTISPECIES: hypothetical protein [unclassified Mesorhizobium]|uniref:hypothetical protein n=1 Tax=unclassified Mesorhizobium TaxID=325217 RepID=UPI000FE6AF58|nr:MULTISPECIES: hypothetical protein [unclassified Mesorhizobium]RWB98727.1 MAG: hypothetical protein EOQ57_20995 [Mesorhizobium sp.]TGV21945.1 hypothetical protein EN786_32085 [Mesorhizobium sp. M4B.F.Ca.ET.143.01.1.1]TIU23757.1 MAG: hypothetical protein E5W49_02830 [Mesorhizobium sp.]
MKASEIPAFVEEVIKAGCDICAVGHDRYVLGDADLSVSELEAALPELQRIEETYGDRDFLRLEIVAHLRALGRYLEPGSSATHWSENTRPN